MIERRYPLRVRTLDPVEMIALKAGPEKTREGTWYRVTCPACRTHFDIHARSLDEIVRRYGFVYCAKESCNAKLWAVNNEEANAITERRLDA